MNIAFQNENVTLWHGDCREVLPQIRGVDTVLTDPPYALPTQVASGRNNVSNLGDLSIAEHYFRGLLVELWEACGDKGQMFLFCDGTFYPVLFRAAYGRPSQALLVWDKGQIGMGREFRKRHELILRLWQQDTPIVTDGTGHADVLQCPPVPPSEREHPAEKPTKLLSDLLWCCGHTVLDPFCGSGSTLIAALETGRKAIGIEIDERWVDVARRRLERWHAQGRLDFGTANTRIADTGGANAAIEGGY